MPETTASSPPGIILGFDETNNGFNLDHPKYKHHPNSIMVVTGYMTPSNSTFHTPERPGSRKKVFNSKRDVSRALELGREYIEASPDYFYTTICYSDSKKIKLPLLRANAIALLTFKFFQHYQLDPITTKLAIDQINGKDFSNSVGYFLQGWLENARLPIKFNIEERSDKKIPAVKKADRIGYYLAAIKFLGDKNHWPYRKRKVSMNQLENLATQIQMNQIDRNM